MRTHHRKADDGATSREAVGPAVADVSTAGAPVQLRVAAGGPEQADALLGLQRSAGNQAALAALQRADGDGTDEPDAGQADVDGVVGKPGRPLADDLRADMEQRLGGDFSDVRLHTDAAARESATAVGARAYTSGSHVVLGDGGGDRHTIAHELVHVMQQRAGAVEGTDTGHGFALSDRRDRFERAAEAGAHRALSRRPEQPAADAAPEPAQPQPATPAVQRVTAEELHREPPGPSVQVRGPRRSHSGRKASTKTNQQDWNTLSTAYQNATGQMPVKERIRLDTDMTSLSEMSPPDTGRQLGNALTTVAQHAGIPLAVGTHARSNAEMVEQLGRQDPATLPYWQAQDARDQQLATDAVARSAQYQAESGDEDAQARREATTGILRGISLPAVDATDMLLLANDGLVIGGPHREEPFFSWAADNMARLHQNGVRTLYVEGIREDVHQHLVDTYLSSGVMSQELTNFCATYQRGHAVDLAAFLAEAHATGMRIKGTGGRPARTVGTNIHRRAVMQNTYGEQVVRRDRAQTVTGGADPGKYLLQAGEAHAGTHTNRQPNPVDVGGVALPDEFPGINELLGVPAVRLDDSLDPRRRLRPI